MKKSSTSLFVLCALAVIILGGVGALAVMHVAPPLQSVEKSVPDDSIPH